MANVPDREASKLVTPPIAASPPITYDPAAEYDAHLASLKDGADESALNAWLASLPGLELRIEALKTETRLSANITGEQFIRALSTMLSEFGFTQQNHDDDISGHAAQIGALEHKLGCIENILTQNDMGEKLLAGMTKHKTLIAELAGLRQQHDALQQAHDELRAHHDHVMEALSAFVEAQDEPQDEPGEAGAHEAARRAPTAERLHELLKIEEDIEPEAKPKKEKRRKPPRPS